MVAGGRCDPLSALSISPLQPAYESRPAMSALPNSLAARDIATLVHPLYEPHRHQEVGPFVIASGDGCYVYDDAGRRYLEGWRGSGARPRLQRAAGWWPPPRGRWSGRRTRRYLGGRSHEPAIDSRRGVDRAEGSLEGAVRQLRLGGQRPGDQATWYYHNAIGKPRRRSSAGSAAITASPSGGQPDRAGPNHADLPDRPHLHTPPAR